ncbi:MAG TPA: universal stress protein, partial [Thioalkalivibrio sp.]|nr:universal stress protein [Thioalkalivibrio sp.]
SVETHVRTSSDPYGEIAATAQKLNCGLIVIGRHERSEFARLLKGQTLGRLIDKAQSSVLVMPAGCGVATSRILVATDGSAPADVAVAAAIDLAARCALPLTALSVHPANGDGDNRNEAYEAVSRAQDAAGDTVEFDGRCLEGKPDETILAVTEESGADLIVMGSNARGGLGRLIKGSVAERVVARAACAVLIAIAS